MAGNAIREALEPFAKVAEHDIGTDEADADFFRPMDRHNKAPRLTVGDLRRARTAYDAIGSVVKELRQQARRVRNYSNPDDIFYAVPVSALGDEIAGPASTEDACSVRKLEWRESVQEPARSISKDDGGVRIESEETTVGQWSVQSFDQNQTFHVLGTIPPGIRNVYTTIDEAKAAAQADFERRVLACLSTHTAAGDGPVDRIDLEAMLKPLDGYDKNQPGYQHRVGWNDAILYVMDVRRATVGAGPVGEDPLWQELRDLFGLDGWHDGAFGGLPSPAQIVTHARHVAEHRAELLLHVAAGAGPVGEAVAWCFRFKLGDGLSAWEVTLDESYARSMAVNGGEVEPLRPVDDPGEVERLTRERDAQIKVRNEYFDLANAATRRAETAEAALAAMTLRAEAAEARLVAGGGK